MAAVEADAAASGQPISLGEKFELLRTHPNSGHRQKHIEKLLPRALDLYKDAKAKARRLDAMGAAKVKLGEGKRNWDGGKSEKPVDTQLRKEEEDDGRTKTVVVDVATT